jgi:hypothetical protein
MASKDKDAYAPLFDFGSNLDPKNDRTGAISELLTEINLDYNPNSGEPANFKSLKPTLELIANITGTKFENTTNRIPLPALKTIKLLFMTNHEIKGMNLFSRIDPPTISGKPTMDSATGTSIARDKVGASVIKALSNQLALEIEADKLKSFYDLLKNSGKRSAAEELNAHIERTNDEIYRLLTSRLGNDNIRLANASYRLAKEIDCFRYTKAEDADPAPLNEAIFAHLQGLGFVHFALHHRDFIRKIRVSQTIHSIDNEVSALCQTLSRVRDATVLPDERIFSVNNFHHLVAGYHREFISLVRAATKLDTRKKTLFDNTLRARRILASHGYRCYDETDLDTPLMSVLDIVAALCAVRYQQDVKTECDPKWVGQVSQGKDPQRHFDKTIDLDDPYQHQGVFQIYFYRFSEYLAAFTKKTASNNAWMAYQVSRFDAYTKILQLNDISGIVASAHHFDELCMQEAMNIADTYSASVV